MTSQAKGSSPNNSGRDHDSEHKIDRNAPAGTENSLGAQSIRDGRPATDDTVVEAIDELSPGETLLPTATSDRTGSVPRVAYFDWNSAIFAPVGSSRTDIHPTFGISTESICTCAPRDLAFFVAAWMSSTPTYASQPVGAFAMEYAPPPGPLSGLNVEYTPIGMGLSVKLQPKSAL